MVYAIRGVILPRQAQDGNGRKHNIVTHYVVVVWEQSVASITASV
eukprot:COSAG06_NODE_6662_length_2836_cov_17.623310_2_plen_45_part_00